MVAKETSLLCDEWRAESLKAFSSLKVLPADSGIAYLLLEKAGLFVRATSIDERGLEYAEELNEELFRISSATILGLAGDVVSSMDDLSFLGLSCGLFHNDRLVELLPYYDRVASVVSGLIHWSEIHDGLFKSAIELIVKAFESLESHVNEAVQQQPELQLDRALSIRCGFNTALFPLRPPTASA